MNPLPMNPPNKLADPLSPKELEEWRKANARLTKMLADAEEKLRGTKPEFPLVGEDPKLTAIQAERQKVYGDPLENHRGIAQAWVGLLQPHWEAIRDGKPIPSWTVAHLMCALKLNRMRRKFSADNYDDLANYAAFAQKWQLENTP